MKTTGKRSFALYIIMAIFLIGMGVLFTKLVLEGQKYIEKPYNGHIYAGDATAQTGDILDSNNLIVAHTQNGKRIYSQDELVRTALLHTVGDSSGYIGTSVQASSRSSLVGYNFITGLNTIPDNPYFGNKDILLTLDASLCAKAYEALNGKQGAVLVSNYLTGEILCKVSAPSYDPMNVPENLSSDPQYEGVFLDNTISSSYTPGSIFKLITATTAIENMENWQTKTYNCDGLMHIGNSTISCLGHHGDCNLQEALGHSCNLYFAQLAMELGADKLQQTAENLGFNKSFSFNDFSSSASSINLAGVSEIDIAWTGVGQGTVLVNPSHYLLLMQAIANDGTAPALSITKNGIFDTEQKSIRLMSKETANVLKELMRHVVSDYYGDNYYPNMELCAKSGTAEIGNGTTNAWFVGFSQNKNTPYAFSVIVEDGGYGRQTAGEVAKQVLEILMNGV